MVVHGDAAQEGCLSSTCGAAVEQLIRLAEISFRLRTRIWQPSFAGGCSDGRLADYLLLIFGQLFEPTQDFVDLLARICHYSSPTALDRAKAIRRASSPTRPKHRSRRNGA